MPLISRIGPAGDFWLIAMPSAVLRKSESTIWLPNLLQKLVLAFDLDFDLPLWGRKWPTTLGLE